MDRNRSGRRGHSDLSVGTLLRRRIGARESVATLITPTITPTNIRPFPSRRYFALHSANSAYENPFRASGSSRTRLPVAAKIALHRAGTNGGTPGSPTPAGGAVLSTM